MFPAKNFIESELFSLNFGKFVSFLKNVYKFLNLLKVAIQYCSIVFDLVHMMYKTFFNLNNRSIKNRLTKIQKSLKLK